MNDGTSRLSNILNMQGRKRQLAIAAMVLCLVPGVARAQGAGGILVLLNTITTTLQGVIGSALSGIQNLNTTINHFRQQIIWPVAALNQAKGFVASIQAQYANPMAQITAIRNNSATLTSPQQLEFVFRSGQAASVAQLQTVYGSVYGAVPSATDAQPVQRNLVDMDDAMAMGSLKTAVLSDQTTQTTLSIADSLERQSATAAPGSGPMLSAQAQVANLETQAYMAKVLAAELRQEAAKLAHQNMLLKQSAAAARNLQNQMQQVLSHP